MAKSYVLFGIDTETDCGSNTPFHNMVKPGTDAILDIYAKHNIKGTFFVTGECAKVCPGTVKDILDTGNEVGVHSLYHETVGDEMYQIPGVKPLLPQEVPLRVKLATEWVEEVSGVKAVSWRCPRLWGSTHVCNALEDLGYKVDATYPMYYYREQFAPYHPSREDWTKKGDMNLLEIPNFADMTMKSKDPVFERDRDQWPLFRLKGADYLFQRILNFEKFVDEQDIPAVLCFYFHPWEFVECKHHYAFGEGGVWIRDFFVGKTGEVARQELDKLCALLLGGDRERVFMRMDEFADEWNKTER